MSDNGGNLSKYMIVRAIGAAGGGLLVAMATRAMPKMMSGMMQKMMGASEKPESQED